ncbi:relaxase/mobilization nuclease domain-containing protein [Helicobacter pylori]|uniref:Relaxase/mobilization nuclease domain-containing protein n=1 Tax=Helicobacter pylori TaxID=210 RepID=A0AAE7ATS9_HELPX|nr:relaxase/mobilization nuclease domain-containing protein [Helicobacter pylori]QJW30128.1 relaxase/mobilization nuclease domain-containing protein [Helicobacter pylori A45]QJW41430.1 relaxase/mobilization nuclease domain-containing protein [Helicobacter pylori]QJW42884.1 relaxase/mobilization nuclease domain-containing protein [Helicobacter pylori]QJW44340.1 relaxase/mobilization nuclease domain-containing protein [Helicobacter pylori]
MLVKFWGIKQGGGDGDGSVNYLLNERVEQGTAKVLKGDANLTKSLLLSLTQKHKACVGCLSFEEPNIDENLKHELIESFENALLTESMQNRYNILWVEHTDKGRLELNFVIPRIDLITQKAFTPYYHSADITRIDIWKDYANLKYTFTNPKDLEKQHNIKQHQTKNPKNKELLATYEKLDKLIQENLGKLFNSRADIINFLKDNQCEVTRQGKDYISVKLPNEPKAKRLKGFYYHETFRTIADIREQLSEVRQRESQREHPNYQRDSDNHAELLRELENKLHERIEHKQRYYERLHQADPSNPREPKEQLPRVRDSQQRTQQNHANETTRARETNPQEPSQEILTNAPNFHHGISHHGGNINGGILSHHSTQQGQGIRAFTERKFATQTANRPIKQRQSTENLQPNTDQEIRGKHAERMLKYATECFNQRSRELAKRERELTTSKEQQDSEFRERQKRAINHARESYSRISKTKQRLLEIRGRNFELERELQNATSNTQHIISQISSFRESRESRIKKSDTNLRTERNLAQKRFTEHVRADFTARITEYSNQRARDFTSSIQDTTDTIREFRNNSQTRDRTILHNLYARTRDAINAIKNFYRDTKERIRDFFQRANERLSKRMEQETRELHTKTTQLDRKIREHNQKIENERSYSRGYER